MQSSLGSCGKCRAAPRSRRFAAAHRLAVQFENRDSLHIKLLPPRFPRCLPSSEFDPLLLRTVLEDLRHPRLSLATPLQSDFRLRHPKYNESGYALLGGWDRLN
jgi:hypothetical protein